MVERPTGPWVAYVGPFLYPEGEAASRRVLGVAESIALTGRDVWVCSGDSVSAPPHPLEHGGTVFHHALGDRPVSMRRAPLRAIGSLVTWGRAARAWLESCPTLPSHVIVYGGLASYAAHIQHWAGLHGVAYVQDLVEWHEPRQFRGGRFSPQYWSSELAMRALYPRADGLIAISSFLQHRFADVMPTIRIPPTTDILDAVPLSDNRSGVSLAYCGTPGNKEVIAPTVSATASLRAAGLDVRLVLAGVDEVAASKMSGIPVKELPSSGVVALGRVPWVRASQIVADADFTVLVRRSTRCTEAGFPTKFVESFARATPVIGNITSDLGDYLIDGETGLVVSGSGVDQIAQAIRRALELTLKQREAMQTATQKSARANFTPECHAAAIGRFLEEVTPDASH